MKTAPLLAMLLGVACSGQLPYPVEAYQTGSTNPPVQIDAGAPPPQADAAPVAMMPDAAPVVTPDAAPVVTPDAAPPASKDAPVSADAPVAGPDASSGGSEGGPPLLASCSTGQDAIALISSRCGACHNAKNPLKNLDLVSPGVGQRILGVKAVCPGHVLLAGTADMPTGVFLDKLLGPVADCGERMPYGTPAFTDAEVSCVTAWAGQVVATGAGR
jgi:hypothetical protein